MVGNSPIKKIAQGGGGGGVGGWSGLELTDTLIICYLSSLMDNHFAEVERLNMDAVKAEHLQKGLQEEARGPISGLIFA